MTAIAASSLVKHVSLGVGKVVAVEPTALHVFFPDAEKRFAAKLRLPVASTLLTSDGVEPNAWLQGLTSFSFDSRTGRYALAANFLTHDDAVAEFLHFCPEGFADAAYAGNGTRSARWRAANAEWTQAFGAGEGERLLSEGDLPEMTRRALRVAGHVTRLAGVMELEALAEALEPGDVVKAYFDALFGLLGAPLATRPRIERLFACSDALGVEPDDAWPMATLFPFIADPARHVLLIPKLASGASSRLGCDLKLKPLPNWGSYAALRDLSNQLLEKLGPKGARDLIDVDGFLHSIATRRPAVEAASGGTTERAKPATRAARAPRSASTTPVAQRKR